MLLSLAQWLQALYPEELSFLRVFTYLTFRAVLAALTALLIIVAILYVSAYLLANRVRVLADVDLEHPAAEVPAAA